MENINIENMWESHKNQSAIKSNSSDLHHFSFFSYKKIISNTLQVVGKASLKQRHSNVQRYRSFAKKYCCNIRTC